MATFGIFVILFGAVLYLGRTILLPIFAAGVVALTLAPLVKAAGRRGISPWITAILIVVVAVGALSLAVTAMAGPVSEWVGRAPEIWTHIKEKFAVLEQPIAAARQLQTALFGSSAGSEISAPNVVLPVVAFITPAAGELLLFFGTLFFFLAGQLELRARFVSLFAERESKLRFLRIMNDIEKHLTGYLVVVSIINATLGVIVGIGAFLLGFPNPAFFGLAAAVLNYIPYVGPAVMVVILFGVGLVTFPSLGHAVAGAARFRRAHHRRRAFHHADHRRPPDHAQSAAGVSGLGLLDVAMGSDRRILGGAALDRRRRGLQSHISPRRRQTSRLNGTF